VGRAGGGSPGFDLTPPFSRPSCCGKPSMSGPPAETIAGMQGHGTPPSKRLYQLVGISQDDRRTVIMTGMELAQANGAREAMNDDWQYVYVLVERESQ